jgi:hypothetical protein
LDLVDLKSRRRADVYHQDDRKWLFDRLEEADLLLNAILENLEIFLLQTGYEPPIAIDYRHRHRHEICLDTDDLIFF